MCFAFVNRFEHLYFRQISQNKGIKILKKESVPIRAIDQKKNKHSGEVNSVLKVLLRILKLLN